MILLVLFSQEQDQSRVYCGKIHSLTLCLRKSVKKVSLAKPPSHSTAAHGLWWHRRGQRDGHTTLSTALQSPQRHHAPPGSDPACIWHTAQWGQNWLS